MLLLLWHVADLKSAAKFDGQVAKKFNLFLLAKITLTFGDPAVKLCCQYY